MNKVGLRVLVTGIAPSFGSVMAAPLGTAFTYQGQLSDTDLPATTSGMIANGISQACRGCRRTGSDAQPVLQR